MVKVFCGMPAWTGTQQPPRLRVPTGISLKEALMELLHMELTPEEGVEWADKSVGWILTGPKAFFTALKELDKVWPYTAVRISLCSGSRNCQDGCDGQRGLNEAALQLVKLLRSLETWVWWLVLFFFLFFSPCKLDPHHCLLCTRNNFRSFGIHFLSCCNIHWHDSCSYCFSPRAKRFHFIEPSAFLASGQHLFSPWCFYKEVAARLAIQG